MKICLIVGTRPEIIKMAPVIHECIRRKLDFFILHTGQHYSYEMDQLFFKELELPPPRYNINAGLKSFRLQIGMMLRKIKEILVKERPGIVLVLGDTNSVLSGALAANQLNIPIGHIEAGLRSHDVAMVEETNRIITDHIATELYTPTTESRQNLIEEGLDEGKIFLTGNTVVDAVFQHKEMVDKKINVFADLGIEKGKYMVITAHRPENVDVHERLKNMLAAFEQVYAKYRLPLLWPIHPRTQKMIKSFSLAIPGCLTLLPPMGYLGFLQLEAHAKIILTDSGSIQEEACILGVPCVTLRDNTERNETLTIGSNVLVGVEPSKIVEGVAQMLSRDTRWKNPYGDGTSAKQILDIVLKK